MAKKRKCIECLEAAPWSMPRKGELDNAPEYEITRLKRLCTETIVCGRTLKTKNIDHEQYCKYFEKEEYCQINPEWLRKEWEERFGDIDG